MDLINSLGIYSTGYGPLVIDIILKYYFIIKYYNELEKTETLVTKIESIGNQASLARPDRQG